MLRTVERKMYGGDSSEEEMAVLPKHTKVVVTGNNRTKSVLVGLHGVVKKAVGSGGWHWLVLTNGIEVKLQRNALCVIEAPSCPEAGETECKMVQINGSDIDNMQSSIKPIKSQRSNRNHKGLHYKSLSCSNSDSNSKSSISSTGPTSKVDLSKLETRALWRYFRHFNLVIESPNPSKEQLLDAVQRHFMSQELDELQVICGFLKAAKRLKSTSCN
ncbi:Sin3 binding region of histone deacetylase complex subunit SAP30 [Carex littledalei]|uniref:Sin3 binding region of histone deacetylase complex subunit SAP30 n=1 Tax=Carex littledalei TaxID=544730 RepID=A0A833QJI5_9POAL|nr:Sin3 binding region of histone deacetylase complex subunit SAP30 [Carex littledalei]